VAVAAVCTLLAGAPSRAQAPLESVTVVIETTMGGITVEIYTVNAPVTADNFLAYVEDRVFDGGSFFRSVRMDNQPNDSVRIEVIQGGPDASVSERLRGPIPLERTTQTGLLHVDGAISMARSGPDTGRASFFICIGDQPSLDHGGHRNLDGQGFAVFGQVTRGMDVVWAIQQQPVDAQQLRQRIRIESVRLVGSAP